MAVNLSNIKSQLKSILDTANTSTAAFDLSTGLNTRVAQVFKVNPARIMPQASLFPWVTLFVDKKDVEHETIAVNQLNAKRRGDLTVSVVGAVWETVVSSVTEDEADENIEILMENIEEIIRRNFKLNNTVSWSKVEDVSYHSLPLDEQTQMRIGVLSLNCRVDY